MIKNLSLNSLMAAVIKYSLKPNLTITFASHGEDENVFGSIRFQMWDGKRAMVSQIIFGFAPKRQQAI